ncbi:class I SAM-dependent methyltransferase [uncultured Flavobacterium sp.]|uniref:THUMP-like domain-containing protein n=1 Tax=uncultured Flavobacterium sp. TaxID=165435 RepID=UPI0030CA1F9B
MDHQTFLTDEIQDFINQNLKVNFAELALKKNPFPSINYPEIINQIVAKSKSKEKLPTWFNTKGIAYPNKISIEQTSSEITAKYKASLIKGDKIIDLSGGFGVDAYYFAKVFKEVYHCEMNKQLSQTVSHNYSVLNLKNIHCLNDDSLDVLKQLNTKFDWIYVDPSRRSDLKGKVFLLKDCVPNVPELLKNYFNFSNNILIKTAPLLDITLGLSELQFVKKIHIIAVKNEIKELLWEIEKDYLGLISIASVNIENEVIHRLETVYRKEYNTSFSLPKTYLYEPNSSIMKSGNMDALSEDKALYKLHQHSHIFTSDKITAFQGRRFQIDKIMSFQKEDMKPFMNQKINCTTRNFPLSVEEIKKKYKIKDGGNIFAFFTTNINNEKIVLICTKIK